MPTSPGRSLCVLVVDNEPDAAETLSLLLELHGYAVRTAPDGPSALAAARADRPDAVLTTLRLPGMDGWELARRLRALFPARPPLIVAVTTAGHPVVAAPRELMDTYSDLLEKAERVAERALSRLRALGQQFPADIPADFLRQLERAHADPAGERRFAVRLAGERDRLLVQLGVARAGRWRLRYWTSVWEACGCGWAARSGRVPSSPSGRRARRPGGRPRCATAGGVAGGWEAGCQFVGR